MGSITRPWIEDAHEVALKRLKMIDERAAEMNNTIDAKVKHLVRRCRSTQH
jgi:hypothetical protein